MSNIRPHKGVKIQRRILDGQIRFWCDFKGERIIALDLQQLKRRIDEKLTHGMG